MSNSRFLLNYKTRIIDLRKPARSVDSRDAARRLAQVSNSENDCHDKIVSKEVPILSRVMKSLEDERKVQVRMRKRHKIKFRKNSLWDKKQRNGKVICIAPENYKSLG